MALSQTLGMVEADGVYLRLPPRKTRTDLSMKIGSGEHLILMRHIETPATDSI